MIGAAIVGLGWWGKNIVRAVQGRSDKLRFVHGVSREIDEARPLAQTHGLRLSADLDAVLQDGGVQAVVLATPHSLHAEQIVRTAAAGKPLLRTRGGKVEERDFASRDSLRAELDAFADAVAGVRPYPVTPDEMVHTISAFEAVTRSLAERRPVRVAEL